MNGFQIGMMKIIIRTLQRKIRKDQLMQTQADIESFEEDRGEDMI